MPWVPVPENWSGTTGSSQRVISEEDRSLLRGDPSGSARMAVAEERINRGLADAVEQQATKDPETRGMLVEASVACHPESEPQKENCAATALSSHPRRIIRVRRANQRETPHIPSRTLPRMTRQERDKRDPHKTFFEPVTTMISTVTL